MQECEVKQELCGLVCSKLLCSTDNLSYVWWRGSFSLRRTWRTRDMCHLFPDAVTEPSACFLSDMTQQCDWPLMEHSSDQQTRCVWDLCWSSCGVSLHIFHVITTRHLEYEDMKLKQNRSSVSNSVPCVLWALWQVYQRLGLAGCGLWFPNTS